MQTIGERLEDARKKKGISIREAAEATKVRGDYLQRFEGNQFDIGLTEIYVRGFLRNYAVFLKLPADRIISDYASLGNGEARPRQPSREVYGRMELSMASAEDRAEHGSPPPESPAQESGRHQPRVPRGSSNLPASPLIDQALIYKGGIALAGLVIVALLFWGIKSLSSGSSAETLRPAATASSAVAPAADGTVTIYALAPGELLVRRQSDNQELYQGPIETNERKEFPNIPLVVTAKALENLRIDYKGKIYKFTKQGWDHQPLDFTKM
jgi:cytoskeleton protein RodZ